MKRVLFAALAITAFYACTDVKENVESVAGVETHLVFTATNEGISPETRTVRMDDGSTWWNASEEISVFYGSGSEGGSKFTSLNTTLQEIVEFDGSIHMSGTGKEFWAVYPYSVDNECDGNSITTVIPAIQTASEGNFSGDAFPTIAKSNTLDLAFWNICGGIKFFVSRSDIKSITFKGNGDEPLAGKVRVSFNVDGKPEVAEVLDGKTEVTLTAPDGGTFKAGKSYYITLLPTALDGGFTMTFITADTKGVVTSDKVQTVKRSIFGVLKNIDSKVSEWESTIVEPETVDLGLSVKWASFNVGATKPEEYGDYFAWGETQPKSYYNWSTYKWCNGAYNKLTKYCTESSSWNSSEPMDNKTILDPEDDAAHANLGDSWRMPTDEEWTELRNNCTWTWITRNGVNGRLVTGSNGNSIFLPAAGNLSFSYFYRAGSAGYYWSSSLYADIPIYAWYVIFGSGSVYRHYDLDRYYGFSVRPVYVTHPESISLKINSLVLFVGGSEQLSATILPTDATDKSVTWSIDNTDVATVDENGNVTAVAPGTATITVSTVDGGYTATCEVTVEEPDYNGHEYVDLGLPSGLKWATMNVGATKPEDYGEYFAWGETEPKSNYYWSTYKWCDGEYNKPTKYCTDSSTSYWNSTEPMDNKTTLDLDDDAAHVNWGGSWRMPTLSEQLELLDNCIWIWTTKNGVNGHLVTSKTNSNSIFLPAAGYRSVSNLYYVGTVGYFWSSSLFTDGPNKASYVLFYSDNVNWDHGSRCYGQSVRAVCPKE